MAPRVDRTSHGLPALRLLVLLICIVLGSPAAAARAAPADASSARLSNVTVSLTDIATVVEVEIAGVPANIRTSPLGGPPRIIVDADGTRFAWSARVLRDTGGPVREIRGSQWRSGIARVVVELSEPAEYRIEHVANGVQIVILASATCGEDGGRGCPRPLSPFIPVQDQLPAPGAPAPRPVPGSEPSSARWDIRGHLQGGGRFYLNERGEGLVDDGIPLEAEVDFRHRLGPETTLRLRPRLAVDPLLSSRNRYEPFDAYVEHATARWALLAGQAVESWAVVDTYNPVDVLNRRDLERDFYDPERLGEVMMRLRYFMPDGGMVEQPTVALYFLPLHRETPLPSNRDRFRFDATGDNRGDLLEDAAVVPSPDVSYAARLAATVGGADVFFVYYGGPTRTPAIGVSSSGDVIPVYHLVDMAGGGVQWAIARWLLKLEMAQTFARTTGLPRRVRGVVPADYFQYVVGIERTIADVFGRAELTVALEYAGEDDPDARSMVDLRPYKSDVFLGARLKLNDLRRTELRASVAADVLVDEQLWLFELVTGLYGDLKLVLGGQLANRAPRGERLTVFNVFPNNSNLWIKLRYDF